MDNKEKEIRAEVLYDSSNKKYWVNIWVSKTVAYSIGLFSGNGQAMMAKQEAERIADKINGKTYTQAIEDVVKVVDNEMPNPYPESVFVEPTDEQYKKIHELLVKEGMTLDKFSGAWGRRVWNNFKAEAIKRIKNLSNK